MLQWVAGQLPHPADLGRHVFVGVDGVDGAGKSTFADELGRVLSEGRDGNRSKFPPAVRISLDGFHRVRQERYRLGRGSAEGFWRDSYDYESFRNLVVVPLSPGGSGNYRTASHDLVTDTALHGSDLRVAEPAVILIDGIFLHRPELVQLWDVSVFLEVSFATSFRRMAIRDGSDSAPDAPANQRYLGGQQLYLRECSPRSQATIVIDNNDFAAPYVVPGGSGRVQFPARRAGPGHRRASGSDTV